MEGLGKGFTGALAAAAIALVMVAAAAIAPKAAYAETVGAFDVTGGTSGTD